MIIIVPFNVIFFGNIQGFHTTILILLILLLKDAVKMNPSRMLVSVKTTIRYLSKVTGVFSYNLRANNSPKSPARITSGFSIVSIIHVR
ncbi:MAG: hypothetical protein NTU44_09545 [Bacteroidetes bacterium]|nr:hypothetical protein [Bacteroidota bacterium]